ncbi:gephyrin-like molybdotransferase receptor GlpR [Rhodococcus sp. HNM0569]|uniref:divisome protein SepX/GlpR n=1 Tax=Rhodococcus sp. HNM0569 TaxID=2716340 RepID=UPI00146BD4D1|nr:gephyrin-like molybdotransferase receptor GlpR [Rhodococcus sp. HNM0569]NLU82610.1 hypothetical protein [Rhodococcus sp. HNM0569]
MPNSVLLIGLVAVWLFVLVPMLASKRPRIRQTSDAALATRVLHRGDSRRVLRGPAAGHRSDPNWQPEPAWDSEPAPGRIAFGRNHARDDEEDLVDTRADDALDDYDVDEQDFEDRDAYGERGPIEDYLPPPRRGRGGFDPEADALAQRARYAFRQRAVLALVFATIMTAALSLVTAPLLWLTFVASALGLVGYLTYLRRQVRIEQDIRRRRLARLERSRLGVESHVDDELNVTPPRLRRPGATVLELDDEDPVFDHLDGVEYEYGYEYAYDDGDVEFYDDRAPDFPMRRAAGE